MRRRGKEEEESAASVVACGDADVRSVLYPFNFVEVAGSAVATEEMQETKQHTTIPTTAALVESRSPIFADGASTGAQSLDDLMGRWGRGPPACAQVVASLLSAEVGAGGPVP